jgi:hypothetical protein
VTEQLSATVYAEHCIGVAYVDRQQHSRLGAPASPQRAEALALSGVSYKTASKAVNEETPGDNFLPQDGGGVGPGSAARFARRV